MAGEPAVAVVGSGLAGFTVYQTLRRGGLAPEEIAVFGTEADPTAAWRRRAAAIRQREMRSESDGHCSPTTFPGLAVRSAVRRRSPGPLIASVLDRYHPTVAEFLAHVAEAPRAKRLGPERSGGPDRPCGAGRGRLRARRRGAVPPRPRGSRPPRAERPRGAARAPARRPCLRAARVRADGHRRRGGLHRRDRVAERARGGRRGRLGAAP